MKSISFCLLLLLSVELQQAEKTALFLGDSLTDGDGVQKQYCFPALVGQEVAGMSTINQGRSGWATSSYLRRWDEVAKKLPEEVDIIFIQLGANDLRVDGHSDKVVQQCADNMREILHRLEERYPEAQFVLMSSTKIDYTHMNELIRNANFGKHTNKYINSIGKEYKKLAKEEGYGFIDLHHKIPLHSTHDGAHLTKEGHRKVADEIVKYIEKEFVAD